MEEILQVKWDNCKKCKDNITTDNDKIKDGLHFCKKNHIYASKIFEQCELLSSSTEHSEKQPPQNPAIQKSPEDKSKLGTPDKLLDGNDLRCKAEKKSRTEINFVPQSSDSSASGNTFIGKIHKAICKECKAEFEVSLDAAAELDKKYGGIYCLKCADDIDKGLTKKEEHTKEKEVKSPTKTCIVCGYELSGLRAFECFQNDPQNPVFKCEDCAEAEHEKEHKKEETGKDAKIKERQTAEPEVIKKEPSQKPQPDACIPIMTQTARGQIIKGFQPSLKEIGKIKIGNKGEERPKAGGGTFRLPVKFDHFEIVSLMRDEKGDFIKDPVMKELGEAPKELDCMLLFNDLTLNFITRYNQYHGGKCLCQGDGATAKQIDGAQVECNPDTCPQFTQKKCKPNGILSVILTKSPRLGGVYKFRTTSFNSIRSILSSMFFLSNLTGGVLAMIPLKLTVSPMQVQPKESAKPQTIYVVNIEFSGTASELLQKTFDVQKYQSAMRENIIRLESTARASLTAPETKEEIKEIEAEFYPEQTKG